MVRIQGLRMSVRSAKYSTESELEDHQESQLSALRDRESERDLERDRDRDRDFSFLFGDRDRDFSFFFGLRSRDLDLRAASLRSVAA